MSKPMRLDAHQHFWSLARDDYGWLTPDLVPIYRDFLPDDLSPILKNAGIEATILVQAAPTLAETEYMLSLAENHTFIKGVVGWVDFEDETAPEQISKLASHPKLVGLRPMIQDIEQADWMLEPKLASSFTALIQNGLTFDALTLPKHLVYLRQLLDLYPGMRVVIDHGSKPDIASGSIKKWAQQMNEIANGSKAYCKLSGLVTEASADWTIEDLRPYVEHLLSSFGPSRLIWGSDWPVCTLTSSYERWLETTDALLIECSDEERNQILGGNAFKAYSL
ncbi:amidohydrolase family protein [Cohaesibacter gelatinilyticus]|uniref:L-fuconolactonase n=1 Tax=Cohaesibacter gelatinilyticus TaxID=372072 RepID=A0A285PK51_9HYPH|nr:amidohydrolase family protein [Cohaesibacter gelatinilyticus]SNZ20261.1 L-fuconolactonase [Cohaesibacter gelatinilyticus]